MKVRALIEQSTQRLRMVGSESPRLDAELLLGRVLGATRVQLIQRSEDVVASEALQSFEGFLRRREMGEPVAYILEEREFFGRAFRVTPHVLIPRPETELIVEEALTAVRAGHLPGNPRIIDLGSGSGCIAVTLLAELATARAMAVDLSPQALNVTLDNARRWAVVDRLVLCQHDAAAITRSHLPADFCGAADLVIANPPYIATDSPHVESGVKTFEPSLALFGGPLGWEKVEAWSRAAAAVLDRPGMLIFEIGYDQGLRAKDIVEGLQIFDTVELGRDYSGWDRWVVGFKNQRK